MAELILTILAKSHFTVADYVPYGFSEASQSRSMDGHFFHFKLIPADTLIDDFSGIPEEPGAYIFLLNGGVRLLEETGYFHTDSRCPIAINKRVHLYTGAAGNLRLRMKQHFRRDRRSSSFRQTLFAVEHARSAISKSRTPASAVACEDTLSEWLYRNVTIGIRLSKRPFDLERKLIDTHVSPFNLTLRRRHPYSRTLSQWRREASFPWGKVRHPRS